MVQSRDNRLDAIRGLAALAVFVAHAGQRLYADGGALWVVLGQAGVAAFFVISGTLIPPSLASRGLHTFWLKRFWRLYPAYWVALAGAVLLHLAGRGATLVNSPITLTPWIVAANLTMAPLWLGAPLALGVAETLVYELAFYLVLTFAARRTGPIAAGLLLVAALTGARVPLMLGLLAAAAAPSPAMLALAVVACLRLDFWPGAGLGLALGTLVGTLAMRYPGSVARPLQTLGRISYSLYLLHPLCLAVLPPLLWPLALPLAWVAERWIEQPFQTLGRVLHTRSRQLTSPRTAS